MSEDNGYSFYYNKIYNKIQTMDFELINDFAKSCPNGPILEIGAGTGRILDAGIQQKLILLDKDPDMLRILKNKTIDMENVSVLEADSCSIPLEDNTVAGCFITMATIHEIKPVLFTLNEIHRVLKKDGLLYLLVVNPNCSRPGTQGLVRNNIVEEEYSLSVASDLTHPPYGYETEFRISTPLIKKTFFIKQSRPPMEFWRNIFKESSFEIVSETNEYTNEKFDEENSTFAMLTLKKSSVTFENDVSDLNKCYDEMAEVYDQIIHDCNYQGKSWVYDFAKELPARNLTILDLGCGNGLVGKLLKESDKNVEIYGIDFSYNMLAQLKERGEYKSIARADLANGLPIIHGRLFDIVTAFGFLEFIPNHLTIFKEIRNSLHIGGEFWGTLEIGEKDFYDSKTNVRKFRYAKKVEVVSLFEKSKLKVISIEEKKAFDSPNFGNEVRYFVFKVKKENV